MINRDGSPITHPLEILVIAIATVLWMTSDAWADYVIGVVRQILGG